MSASPLPSGGVSRRGSWPGHVEPTSPSLQLPQHNQSNANNNNNNGNNSNNITANNNSNNNNNNTNKVLRPSPLVTSGLRASPVAPMLAHSIPIPNTPPSPLTPPPKHHAASLAAHAVLEDDSWTPLSPGGASSGGGGATANAANMVPSGNNQQQQQQQQQQGGVGMIGSGVGRARANSREQQYQHHRMMRKRGSGSGTIPGSGREGFSSIFKIGLPGLGPRRLSAPNVWSPKDKSPRYEGKDQPLSPEPTTPTTPIMSGMKKSESKTRGIHELTLTDIKSFLASYTDIYTIELMPCHAISSTTLSVLRVEGCAYCLSRNHESTSGPPTPPTTAPSTHSFFGITSDHNNNNNSASTTAISSPYVVLCCKLLECKHVLHLSCLVASLSLSSTSSPVLSFCHCTSFFRGIPIPPSRSSSWFPPPPASHGTITPNGKSTRRCILEISIAHVISNAQIVRLVWPYAVNALYDGRTATEYLQLALASPPPMEEVDTLSGDTQSSSDNSSKVCTSSGIKTLDAATKASIINTWQNTFSVTRGQMIFKCSDEASGESWVHTCNYDISSVGEEQWSSSLFKLICVDASTRHVLTLGLQRMRPAAANTTTPSPGAAASNDTNKSAIFALAHVKYEFAPNGITTTPSLVAPLPCSTSATSPSAVAAATAAAAAIASGTMTSSSSTATTASGNVMSGSDTSVASGVVSSSQSPEPPRSISTVTTGGIGRGNVSIAVIPPPPRHPTAAKTPVVQSGQQAASMSSLSTPVVPPPAKQSRPYGRSAPPPSIQTHPFHSVQVPPSSTLAAPMSYHNDVISPTSPHALSLMASLSPSYPHSPSVYGISPASGMGLYGADSPQLGPLHPSTSYPELTLPAAPANLAASAAAHMAVMHMYGHPGHAQLQLQQQQQQQQAAAAAAAHSMYGHHQQQHQHQQQTMHAAAVAAAAASVSNPFGGYSSMSSMQMGPGGGGSGVNEQYGHHRPSPSHGGMQQRPGSQGSIGRQQHHMQGQQSQQQQQQHHQHQQHHGGGGGRGPAKHGGMPPDAAPHHAHGGHHQQQSGGRGQHGGVGTYGGGRQPPRSWTSPALPSPNEGPSHQRGGGGGRGELPSHGQPHHVSGMPQHQQPRGGTEYHMPTAVKPQPIGRTFSPEIMEDKRSSVGRGGDRGSDRGGAAGSRGDRGRDRERERASSSRSSRSAIDDDDDDNDDDDDFGPDSRPDSRHSSPPPDRDRERISFEDMASPSMTSPTGSSPSPPPINLTMEQVVGNVVRLAKSHAGSRFVQQKLDARDVTFFNVFFAEMKDHLAELMVDNFGHFAVGKSFINHSHSL
jgi:hypothetical protein